MKKDTKDIKLAYRVAYLLAGYIKNNLSAEEARELDTWKNESQHNRKLFAELTDEKNIQASLANYDQTNPESYLEKSKERLIFRKPPVIRSWFYAAAASVILVIIAVLYFKPFSNKEKPDEIVFTNTKDIPPGYSQATLTLGDGRQIKLDRDTLINGAIQLSAKNGVLEYQHVIAGNPEYHTLTIPRKGFYKLQLPDSTVVYLNAASSIRYPTAFTGNERKVYVTGETYFEVAHNKAMPFRVVAGELEIEALGTAFNVNVYADELASSAALIEGSVRVSGKSKAMVLQPGQQAIYTGGNLNVIVSPKTVSAWKENKFIFSNTPLSVIMRQLARWYDVEIIYQENLQIELNATIDRNVPLSRLLELLSKTKEVHFKVEGNKIIVMQ